MKFVALFAVFILPVAHCGSAFSFRKDYECVKTAYPPGANVSVPRVVVDLDLPPKDRWKEVINLKKDEILNLRTALVNLIGKIPTKMIDYFMPSISKSLPSPYKEEIEGLSELTGMPLGEVVLYNLFYEFFTVCTSIVAYSPEGHILHGRNLDFGLLLGWNATARTWSMTEVLRRTVVEIEWKKNNKTLFYSTNFAGYIGLLTAFKPGVMSMSIDERFQLNGGYLGLMQWIMAGRRDLQWVGFLARDLFEQEQTYRQARETITKSVLLAPVYFILGGTKAGEGTILTKDRNKAMAKEFDMAKNKNGDWFVLQTNYDQDKKPPFFDDRRTPGNRCMKETGKDHISFEGLFNVLSTRPVLNKLTAYTTLMNVNTGAMETYLQKCEGDCPVW